MTTPGAVTVIAPIEPRNDGAFHIVEDVDVKGGAHAVADVTARDAIPTYLLTPGTIATLPDGTQYVWDGSAWNALGGGGGAVDSVNGQTGVVVLDASDVGAAPSAHASQHKHGGADEVATATPAANAIPKAGASGRLTAGWMAGAAVASQRLSSGLGLPGGDHVAVAGLSAIAHAAGDLTGQFFVASDDVTVVRADINVSAAGAAGALAEIGIYAATRADDGSFAVGALLASLGAVAIDSIGQKTITGLSVLLEKGQAYLLAVACSQAATLRCYGTAGIAPRHWRGDNLNVNRASWALASSAFPLPPTPSLTDAVSNDVRCFTCVGLQW